MAWVALPPYICLLFLWFKMPVISRVFGLLSWNLAVLLILIFLVMGFFCLVDEIMLISECLCPIQIQSTHVWLPYICLLFLGFSNVYHSACVWPTALKLGCVTNLDTLFLVMEFMSLVDEIQFMLISSRHICIWSIRWRDFIQNLWITQVCLWLRELCLFTVCDLRFFRGQTSVSHTAVRRRTLQLKAIRRSVLLLEEHWRRFLFCQKFHIEVPYLHFICYV